MPLSDGKTLWDTINSAEGTSDRFLIGHAARVRLTDLARRTSLGGRVKELHRRSVLIATKDQLTAALALIELDGIARRLILCPPGLAAEQARFVAGATGADSIVSDQIGLENGVCENRDLIPCKADLCPGSRDRIAAEPTEWILLTSGTTGTPKMVVHTLSSLCNAIKDSRTIASPPSVWSTFYDIRRYGGLLIFLRVLFGSGSLILSSAEESTADFLIRAGQNGVTHISGTPSHWRLALMSPAASRIAPQYIRLSGEAVDQTILKRLRSFYPQATICHAFASTEAGLAFEVNDGLAGFPEGLIGPQGSNVDLKVQDGSLRIRSTRTATSLISRSEESLKDEDGFVDTGDTVELREGRYYFAGRREGIINIGGLKVHPEEVEAVINQHPQVRMSLVRSRKNHITGGLVVADVVLQDDPCSSRERIDELQREILQLCRSVLPRYKVPASISIVPTLAIAATGKVARHHA